MEKERIIIDGWKGKDNIEIVEKLTGFDVVEHRQNKETGEIAEQIHFVPLENVKFMISIIDNLDIGYKVGYRYIINRIIQLKNLEVSTDAFNGGKNRAKYYFPFYYYPLKVLEKKNKVKYFGRGGIMRLR